MGWFDGFREEGRNTYYPRQRAPVAFDLSLIFVLVFCCIVVVSLLIVIVGTRGKERWSTFLRIVFTLHTGLVIFLVQFGQEWQTAEATTRCPYTTKDLEGLEADINIKVGLRCVNVTLAGTLEKEYARGEVAYNERFWFIGVHEIQGEFQKAKTAGLPQAILYILEYFSVDDGDMRWMRAIRLGGHFAFTLIWAALAAWILANIMLCFEVSRGALTFMLSGILMILACIIYNQMQPFTPLTIPFEDAYIDFHYGWCFWLTLTSGILAAVTGFSIWVIHMFYPVAVGHIFLIDTTHLDEEQERVTEVEPLNFGDLPVKSIQPRVSFDNSAFEGDDNTDNTSIDSKITSSRRYTMPRLSLEFSSLLLPSPSQLSLTGRPSIISLGNLNLQKVPEDNYDSESLENEKGGGINSLAEEDSEEAPPSYSNKNSNSNASGSDTTINVSIENETIPEENLYVSQETEVHRL